MVENKRQRALRLAMKTGANPGSRFTSGMTNVDRRQGSVPQEPFDFPHANHTGVLTYRRTVLAHKQNAARLLDNPDTGDLWDVWGGDTKIRAEYRPYFPHRYKSLPVHEIRLTDQERESFWKKAQKVVRDHRRNIPRQPLVSPKGRKRRFR